MRIILVCETSLVRFAVRLVFVLMVKSAQASGIVNYMASVARSTTADYIERRERERGGGGRRPPTTALISRDQHSHAPCLPLLIPDYIT